MAIGLLLAVARHVGPGDVGQCRGGEDHAEGDQQDHDGGDSVSAAVRVGARATSVVVAETAVDKHRLQDRAVKG